MCECFRLLPAFRSALVVLHAGCVASQSWSDFLYYGLAGAIPPQGKSATWCLPCLGPVHAGLLVSPQSWPWKSVACASRPGICAGQLLGCCAGFAKVRQCHVGRVSTFSVWALALVLLPALEQALMRTSEQKRENNCTCVFSVFTMCY